MSPVPCSRSFVQMTELVLPNHLNQMGTAFGGVIMSWMDIAGSISARRHCSKNVVTASIDEIHFLAPVYKGDVVGLQAQVNYTHRSSMEVEVRVTAESPEKESSRQTALAYLTFVALDESYKPSPVPPLKLETEAEKKRFESAKKRREWRLKRKDFLLK